MYDKCKCFLQCFPLISVNNVRKRAMQGAKLFEGVDFQPISSEVGKTV